MILQIFFAVIDFQKRGKGFILLSSFHENADFQVQKKHLLSLIENRCFRAVIQLDKLEIGLFGHFKAS